MRRSRQPTEFDLLEIYVEEMERLGQNRKLVRLSIDDGMAAQISSKFRVKIAPEQLQRLTDRCLANEWLKHTVSGNKYRDLELTTTGLGIVRSRQRKEESLANRSFLKRVSDYLEDRKGLFTACNTIISLLALTIALTALVLNPTVKLEELPKLFLEKLIQPIVKLFKG